MGEAIPSAAVIGEAMPLKDVSSEKLRANLRGIKLEPWLDTDAGGGARSLRAVGWLLGSHGCSSREGRSGRVRHRRGWEDVQLGEEVCGARLGDGDAACVFGDVPARVEMRSTVKGWRDACVSGRNRQTVDHTHCVMRVIKPKITVVEPMQYDQLHDQLNDAQTACEREVDRKMWRPWLRTWGSEYALRRVFVGGS